MTSLLDGREGKGREGKGGRGREGGEGGSWKLLRKVEVVRADYMLVFMTEDVLCSSQFQDSNLIACSCKLCCDMVTTTISMTLSNWEYVVS